MQEVSDQNTSEQTSTTTPSLFTSGTFVIGLIVVGLFVTLITWSVSFAALFFGALGTFLSIASCSMDHQNLCFKSKKDCHFSDENWAYFVMRAVAGAVFGTATSLIVVQDFATTHWAVIAVLAIFGAFIFDHLLFKRRCQ